MNVKYLGEIRRRKPALVIAGVKLSAATALGDEAIPVYGEFRRGAEMPHRLIVEIDSDEDDEGADDDEEDDEGDDEDDEDEGDDEDEPEENPEEDGEERDDEDEDD